MKQFTVYNVHTFENEFTGTHDECQGFIGSYGGEWAALNIRPTLATEQPIKESRDSIDGFTPGEIAYNEISMYESAFEIITLSPNGQDSNGYIAKIQCSLYTVPGRARANAERMVTCWNEYDVLKAENTSLKEDVRLLRVELFETICDLQRKQGEKTISSNEYKRLIDCVALYDRTECKTN